MIVGTEWLVEAAGCDAEKLRDESVLRGIFDRVVDDLGFRYQPSAEEHAAHADEGLGIG